jgi:hypothetical protein
MHGDSGTVDYGPVIADLRRRRDELDRMIQGLEAMAGLPGSGSPSGGGPSGGAPLDGTPVAVGRHEFVGRSTPEATKMYLSKVKRLASPREISAALVAGGLGESEDAVYVNVYSALKRLRANGDVVKHRQEWGLTEHYPNLARKGKAKKDDDVDEDEAEDQPDAVAAESAASGNGAGTAA